MNRAQQLLRQYGFPAEVIRAQVGFTNEVWLGETAVVKIFPTGGAAFERERWFYRTLHPDFAPALLAEGEDFLLLERLHGEGLFRAWAKMDDWGRRDMVRQIARMVREIDAVPLDLAGGFLPRRERWRETVVDETMKSLRQAQKQGAIPEPLANRAEDFISRATDALGEQESLSLVDTDLHFDNFLLGDDGRLRLLDFEMLEAAPRDLVLDLWNRMTFQPWIYANETDEPLVRREDYRRLLRWFAEELPEWFSHPRLPERLALYGLWYDLRMLLDYPGHAALLKRVDFDLCGNFDLKS